VNEKEFNLKCADYMGYEYVSANDVRVFSESEDTYTFNPYLDANSRNKVIEKMRINTEWGAGQQSWLCRQFGRHYHWDDSMEAAQIACITKVLESKQ